MSSQSLSSSVSESSHSPSPMHGGDGDPEDYTTVTQQLTSFTNLSENLHNVIGQVSGDEFRNYSKRDRAGAALLTAGIKANIIEEIREEAKERNNESVGGKGDAWGSSMEGRMAKAAFVAMKRDMVGKGKGIKIIKHARNGTSRVVKLKLKKIPPMYDDDYSSGSEEEGEQKIKGVRHDGRKNVEQERKSLEQVKVEDEFADPNWDQDTLKHTKEVVEELGGEGSCVGGPFLSYRGGFWNKEKKKIDLTTLREVKKGIQTDVLKNGSTVSTYKNYAYLSLEFENNDTRSFDLEIPDGDVSVRDQLLHGFKFVAKRNEQAALSKIRLHSWDLGEDDANDRMRRAWDGRTSSVDDALRGQVQSWVEQRTLLTQESRDGSISTETVPDELVIGAMDRDFIDNEGGGPTHSRSSSFSSIGSLNGAPPKESSNGSDYEDAAEELELYEEKKVGQLEQVREASQESFVKISEFESTDGNVGLDIT